MTHPDDTRQGGDFAKLIDEQLDLAASRLPALAPEVVHPSPVDHDEVQTAHPTFEDVLLARPSRRPRCWTSWPPWAPPRR